MTDVRSPSTAGRHTTSAVEVPVERLDVAVYEVPTDQPEADGTMAWTSTTAVVVEVHAGGQVGLGWTYAAAAAAGVVWDLLARGAVGRDVRDVPATWGAMQRRMRNVGRPGIASCALSAVDVALWDCAARVLDLPAVRLLGRARERVPVYGSGGFTTYDEPTATAQLRHWVDELGLPRVKIKIGEGWGRRERRDLTRTEHARAVVGDQTELFVDANGGYAVGQAVRVGAALDDLGVTWFEEPVSSDDTDGLRQVRERVRCDVAAGEYAWSLADAQLLCRAGAVDCLQADATRCGGWTEWLRVAAVAAAHQLDISAHCAPALHAPVAAAAPNLRHVEWFHDHVRVERLLLEGVQDPVGGDLVPDPTTPGHGLRLAPAAAAYRVG